MPAETPLLRIEDLAVSFGTERGRVRAVHSVNLRVYPRQTLAVVGESGCGKSVSALSILRLVPTPPGRYDAGHIWWNADAASLSASARRDTGHEARDTPIDLLQLPEREMRSVRGNQIAMIFQEPMTSLNPVYTLGEQVLEAIRLHQRVGRREAIDLAEAALADVGIADPRGRLKEYPHHLSGGMRQRVMIAMALACRPRLLLADEPTTALDVTIQAQILELLRKLQEERGMSVLLITHDLGVVAENADAVAVMYAGRVVEYGSVHDVFRAPLHPYTRGLFASMPVLGRPRDRLTTIPGNVPNPADFPPGCPFHPRCALTRELAAGAPGDTVEVALEGRPVRVMRDTVEKTPPLREVEPGHWVACWHAPGFDAGRETKPDVTYRREAQSAPMTPV